MSGFLLFLINVFLFPDPTKPDWDPARPKSPKPYWKNGRRVR